MDVKDIIKNRRIELGLTMKQVADSAGVSEGTVSRWESGDISNMRRDKIVSLANALMISPAVIMGWKEDPAPSIPPDLLNRYGLLELETRTLPVLGKIACGEPKLANEEVEYVTVKNAPEKADCVLIASGDSMVNARILDGDYVFIQLQNQVENGEIAAVIIDNEATLKRFYYDKEKQTITLMAENPKYPPLFFSGQEMEDIKIIGRALTFQSPVK